MVKVQVKILYSTNYAQAQKDVNKTLEELQEYTIRDVKVDTDWSGDEDHYISTIIYEV